jgi:hypothetical protein
MSITCVGMLLELPQLQMACWSGINSLPSIIVLDRNLTVMSLGAPDMSGALATSADH